MKPMHEELAKVRARLDESIARDVERWRRELHEAVDAYGDARATEEELRVTRGKYEPMAARLTQARRAAVTEMIERWGR